MHEFLKIGRRVSVLPVIHGSAECALQVRRVMLEQRFDCLAVPLPPSFQQDVEAGIHLLPTPMIVVQSEPWEDAGGWSPADQDDGPEPAGNRRVSYVPVDPCQAVVMGLRIAMGEHLPRAFIDRETSRFQPMAAALPDAYALKRLPIERFAAAVLPFLPRPPAASQTAGRIRHMAGRLRQLERRYASILLICSVLDWPWLRESWGQGPAETEEAEPVEEPDLYQPDPRTLLFLLGELPFITALYERARDRLEDDENLSVDGVKELLLAARHSYRRQLRTRARPLTPQTMACCLKYLRNLTLSQRRLTPDLYTIVTAAQQVAGDAFALHVAERARDYQPLRDTGQERVAMGIGRLRLPDGRLVPAVSRLPGPPLVWKRVQLQPRPDQQQARSWQMRWNPLGQCSWPPEDQLIENFRAHVTDRAKAIMGTDLVRTEKFTTSVKDGIDIRDTLRNWHTGDIYVKVLPPTRGQLDAVVMLFDSPADPRDYPWRATWFAEHQNESTLAFFGSDFMADMVGPGIGVATYGGALFLFPPRTIPDIWVDRRLDFTETLEERLLAAACVHSTCPQIALLSPLPPGPGWRRLARRFRKRWVHVPLGQFSAATVQQLRLVHVLNGREVRSYAAHFIRRA
jgi:hypothetical protein